MENKGQEEITIPTGVVAIIANAHQKLPMGSFTFEGELSQMAAAREVAREFGIESGTAGGYTYVMSKAAYDEVVQYIVDHQIEGYELYQ